MKNKSKAILAIGLVAVLAACSLGVSVVCENSDSDAVTIEKNNPDMSSYNVKKVITITTKPSVNYSKLVGDSNLQHFLAPLIEGDENTKLVYILQQEVSYKGKPLMEVDIKDYPKILEGEKFKMNGNQILMKYPEGERYVSINDVSLKDFALYACSDGHYDPTSCMFKYSSPMIWMER